MSLGWGSTNHRRRKGWCSGGAPVNPAAMGGGQGYRGPMEGVMGGGGGGLLTQLSCASPAPGSDPRPNIFAPPPELVEMYLLYVRGGFRCGGRLATLESF